MEQLERNYRQAIQQLNFMLNNDDSIDIQSKKLWCQHFLLEYKQVIDNQDHYQAYSETKSELLNCINLSKK